jgi:hypothetical protein
LNLLAGREYSPDFEGDSTMEPNTPSESSVPLVLTPSSTPPSPFSSMSDITDLLDVDGTKPGLPARTFVTIELVPLRGSVHSGLEKDCTHAVTKFPNINQLHVYLEYPSDMANDNPILTFSTPRKISTSQHYSYFRVLIGDAIAHSEVTELAFVSTSFPSPTGTERHTYNTKLIPLFWAHLCRTAREF